MKSQPPIVKARTKLLLLGSGIAVTGLLVACGTTGIDALDSPRGKGDAPVAESDDSGAYVTNMPNGFGNVATKCLNGAPGFRVTVTTRGTGDQGNPSIMTVTPDDSCRG